ncbi:MAG: cyclic nucleotide-binding domain-containing protein [Chromatiaceae bacterium]|nr:cyclic nucleotide-binding domain-containing protein [Gammaproteobacteria bacterium]MCB1860887.1 cyclic nucleotide-binding domain-containing protein [Gammaproteobacteria bacterium]MCB1872546.1 cyclic nucleotide-binding domain-containing protein [Gammaproteobacteria bacterium]MCB1878595.1 cyclic nucleotide-binding domain-containing protein [Gammaproteobacteria bacterium]MCP5448639.1 cyclic nucleotide-binding domain-containing protein [Chromatiaceae bacterium]
MISILKDIIGSSQFPEKGAWKRHYFSANEIILTEGEEGHTLFFVEAGKLRVSGHVDIDNRAPVRAGICDLEPGDVFGEICLYGAHPRSASVVALTEGSLVEVDGERLSVFLDAHPIEGYLLLKELFQTMGRRLHLANQRVEKLFSWGLKAHGIEKHL